MDFSQHPPPPVRPNPMLKLDQTNFSFQHCDRNTHTYSCRKRERSPVAFQPRKRSKPIQTVVRSLFEPETGLVLSDATPIEKLTTADPSNFPVDFDMLEKDGFTQVKPNVSSYDIYRSIDTKDNKRCVVQKGFLMGNPVDFPAVILFRSKLEYGAYKVTGEQGQFLADIFVTAHISNQSGVEDIYRQFNPANYPIVADIIDVTKEPNIHTHHLALSNRLPPGEYRMTCKRAAKKYSTGQFWVQNLRLVKFQQE